jgi:hypothetical protein
VPLPLKFDRLYFTCCTHRKGPVVASSEARELRLIGDSAGFQGMDLFFRCHQREGHQRKGQTRGGNQCVGEVRMRFERRAREFLCPAPKIFGKLKIFYIRLYRPLENSGARQTCHR